MLIVPAATAQLLTRRLLPMLLASCAAAVLAAVLGHAGALWLPPLFGFEGTTTSGMMAFASGVLFLVALVPFHCITHDFQGKEECVEGKEEGLAGIPPRRP